MADSRPRLAITLGDPAGIGPEVVLKALQHREVFATCRPLVIGDQGVLDRAAAWLEIRPRYERIADIGGGKYEEGTVPLLDLANVELAEVPVGQVSAGAGRAAVEYVTHACDLALAGQVEALVTAPLNKEAMHRAGFLYPGHTELLAERTGADRVSMLLVGPNLRVVHVSTHVALEEAIGRVTPARVLEVIELAYHSCKYAGDRGAADCGRGAEPPRQRKRAVRRAGEGEDPTGHRKGPRPRLDGLRTATTGYGLSARDPGRVRHRRGHVPRPGSYSDEAAGL